jgi:hypothetical protein
MEAVTMARHPSPAIPAARLVVFTAILALGSSFAVRARAEEGGIHLFGHDYSVIIGASTYAREHSSTRAIYGARTFTPAVNLWDFHDARGLGVSLDIGGQLLRRGDARAELLHGSFGPRILFAGNQATVAPYLAVRGGACVVHLDHSAWTTRPTANVELGASVLRHFVISARYDRGPRVGGVDFSGFGARVAFRVY